MEQFKKESETYKREKDRLLKEGHEGCFVLIKEDKLIGIFKTPEEAYGEGLKSFGNVSMYIKKISKDEPTSSAPAMYLGLLHAYIQ